MKIIYLLFSLILNSVCFESYPLTFEQQREKDDQCGKNKKWCQRTKGCVRPCGECKAPYVIGDQYFCTKLNYCKVGEWCRGNKCIGRQYGQNYSYYPSDIDPCLNHN